MFVALAISVFAFICLYWYQTIRQYQSIVEKLGTANSHVPSVISPTADTFSLWYYIKSLVGMFRAKQQGVFYEYSLNMVKSLFESKHYRGFCVGAISLSIVPSGVTIFDASIMRQILVSKISHVRKSDNYVILKQLLGNGLLTSEPAIWKKQRPLLNQVFTQENLSHMNATMVELVQQFC